MTRATNFSSWKRPLKSSNSVASNDQKHNQSSSPIMCVAEKNANEPDVQLSMNLWQ